MFEVGLLKGRFPADRFNHLLPEILIRGKVKVAVVAGLLAKGNVNVDSGHDESANLEDFADKIDSDIFEG